MDIRVTWSALRFKAGGIQQPDYPSGDIHKNKYTNEISRYTNPFGGTLILTDLEIDDLLVTYTTSTGFNNTY